MASINKLAIRGVRAFSPDDDEQVISFGFPLTIIVGSNGCGKTSTYLQRIHVFCFLFLRMRTIQIIHVLFFIVILHLSDY